MELTDELRWRVEDRHGERLIQRLQSLLLAGYYLDPRFQSDQDTTLYLSHPDKRAIPVCLWSDGQVVDMWPSREMPDDQRTIIAADDDQAFKRFVARTPRPGFLRRLGNRRTAEAWSDLWAHLIIWGFIIGFSLLVSRCWDAAF